MMKYIKKTVRKKQLKLKTPVGSSAPSASTPVDASIIDDTSTRTVPLVNPFNPTNSCLDLSGVSDDGKACDEVNPRSSSDNPLSPSV